MTIGIDPSVLILLLLAAEVLAVEDGHGQVEQDEVGPAVLAQAVQGVGAVVGQGDAVTGRGEDHADRLPRDGVVVDQKNALVRRGGHVSDPPAGGLGYNCKWYTIDSRAASGPAPFLRLADGDGSLFRRRADAAFDGRF